MLNDAVRCALESWPWGDAKALWDKWLNGDDTNIWLGLGDQDDVTATRKGEASGVKEEVPASAEQVAGLAGAGATADAEVEAGVIEELVAGAVK